MSSTWWRWGWRLGTLSALVVSEVSAISGNWALAQITPDSTLGTESSVVTPLAPSLPIDQINGGAIRGVNLFHSFLEFNVSAGRGAYFANPAGIENILSRVTGNDPSDILGTLGVFGSANLFLINPNGIIFGPSGSLDIRGSFVATTANAIQLGETGRFSASAPETSNLLSVNPSAFFFNALSSQAEIVNRSTATNPVLGFSFNGLQSNTRLQVANGQSLLLVGSNVKLEEGGSLNALGGQVGLGGLAEAGTIGLEINGSSFSLNFAPNSLLSDVTLANDAQVNVQGSGGGNIVVNANTFTAADGGRLVAGTEGLGDAGDITVNTNNFSISGVGSSGLGSGLYNQALANSFGNAGNIFINTKTFNASSGATIASITNGFGDASDIRIISTNSSNLVDGYVQTLAGPTAIGDAGNIYIETGAFTASGTNSFLFSSSNGDGNSGNIDVSANSVILLNGSSIYSAAGGLGAAGNVTIVARDLVELADGYVQTTTGPDAGNAGNIFIMTDTFRASGDNSYLWSSSRSDGNSGNITIAGNSVSLSNGSNIYSSALNGSGKAGDAEIVARDLVELTDSYIQTTAESSTMGDAGGISITTDTFRASGGNAYLWSRTRNGIGNSGNITLTADSVTFLNGSGIDSSTLSGFGNAGRVEINANSLQLENSTVDTKTRNAGRAGDVFVNAKDVGLSGDSWIESGGILAQGRAGSIIVQADGSVSLASSRISSTVISSDSDSGDISITAGSLSLSDEAFVETSTDGQGNAGSINVRTTDSVNLDNNSTLSAFATGRGGGGNVLIETGSLNVRDRATVDTGTSGSGDAGNLSVRARDSVSLVNDSTLSVFSAGGSGGNVLIETGKLSILNGAQVFATSSSDQPAGNLTVKASDSVEVIGTSASGTFQPSGLFTDTSGTGAAGSLTITTGRLMLLDGAKVSTSTLLNSGGQGGTLEVTAADFVEVTGTSAANNLIRSALLTESAGTGTAGNLSVTTGKLMVRDGASVSASTLGNGLGGTLEVTASDSVEVIGRSARGFRSELNTQTSGFGDKAAGNLRIDTGQLIVQDGARVTVSSQQMGNAGDLEVTASSIRLDNQGTLIGETESGNGGNITLQSQDLLLLRRNSNISTTAGTAQDGGNGGNITIDSPFIVAVPSENSNITANAYTGTGGRVQIATQGIFGIQFRQEETPLLSDITASSEFGVDGVVEINTPDADPTRGIVVLPAEVVDVSKLIASSCRAPKRQDESEFIITGRGGLPPSPSDPFSSDTVWRDLRPITKLADNLPSSEEAIQSTNFISGQLVEAQGWITNNKGEVVLTAQAPTATPHEDKPGCGKPRA